MLIGQDHKNCVKHQKISEFSSDSSPADRLDGYEKTVVFAKLCSYTEAHTQGIILGQKKKACQK
jgi:hypothetical protein